MGPDVFEIDVTLQSSDPRAPWPRRKDADEAILRAFFEAEARLGFPVSADTQATMRALMQLQGSVPTRGHMARKPRAAAAAPAPSPAPAAHQGSRRSRAA